MRPARYALILSVVLALPAAAQEPRGATIFGTVRDSAGMPIPAADVVAQPGNHRTRTDSTGVFRLIGLDGGSYTVASRKLGYAPERWDIKVSKNGRMEVKFVLGRRMLDTIRVVAKGDCPQYSVNGFLCRRRAGGGGVYMDFDDIDERGAHFSGELFRDIPGFRVELRRTRYGPVPMPVKNGSGCITSLVDGYPITSVNQIPERPGDLTALEVYHTPSQVPEPYQRYTWPERGVTRSGRCAVAIYWTIWAPMSR